MYCIFCHLSTTSNACPGSNLALSIYSQMAGFHRKHVNFQSNTFISLQTQEYIHKTAGKDQAHQFLFIFYMCSYVICSSLFCHSLNFWLLQTNGCQYKSHWVVYMHFTQQLMCRESLVSPFLNWQVRIKGAFSHYFLV